MAKERRVTDRVTPPDDPIAERVKAPEVAAIGMIKDATAYFESARQLDKLPGGTASFTHPIYFLLSQAIELALKAYLSASGVPTKKLRDKVGHDINNALRRAQKLGLDPADDRFVELAEWLAPFHLEHFFRYRETTGSIQLPPASEAAVIIGNTIAPIERYVREQSIEARRRAANDS